MHMFTLVVIYYFKHLVFVAFVADVFRRNGSQRLLTFKCFFFVLRCTKLYRNKLQVSDRIKKKQLLTSHKKKVILFCTARFCFRTAAARVSRFCTHTYETGRFPSVDLEKKIRSHTYIFCRNII